MQKKIFTWFPLFIVFILAPFASGLCLYWCCTNIQFSKQPNYSTPIPSKEDIAVINKRLKQVQETPIKVFLNVFQIYALTEMGPWLNQITIPSLVMTGQNDISCNPKINKKIAMTLKNSQLEILSDLKHAITLEAPKLVGSKIKKFLNGLKN